MKTPNAKPHTTLLLACAMTATAMASGNPDALTDVAPSTATGLLVGKLTGETFYDRLWSAMTLYKDEHNPVLQEFALQGRLQLQTMSVDESGNHYDIDDLDNNAAGDERYWGDDVEVRRARFGFKSKWFNQFKLEGQFDLDPDFDYHAGDPDIVHGFAKQIYDLYLTYAPNDAFNVSVGKTKVKFSREQEISSKEILTFERSLLSNALFPGELTGIWVNGKGIANHWLYEAGLYSTERNTNLSFFKSDAGKIVLLKVGYDYSDDVGLDSAVAGIHYLHNSEPGDMSGNGNGGTSWPNTSSRRSPLFSECLSINNDIVQGRWGLTTEILWGNGYGTQSDVMGLTLIPSYFIADSLQLVGRFHWASSADPNDLSLPSRYEGVIPGDDRGDNYYSLYLGLNYYLYGHKLKLMTGIEYASMDGNGRSGDYDGYTLLAGLRMYF